MHYKTISSAICTKAKERLCCSNRYKKKWLLLIPNFNTFEKITSQLNKKKKFLRTTELESIKWGDEYHASLKFYIIKQNNVILISLF